MLFFFFQVKQSALGKVDEKCKAISKTIVNHLRTSKRKMLRKMFNLSKSDLMANSDRSTYTIDSIHTTIENEIMSWCTQNKDDVTNEIENMIKKELFILEEDLGMQDGIFGSIDACQSQYGPKVMSCCAMFGLSPIASCVLFGLLHTPVLSIFVKMPTRCRYSEMLMFQNMEAVTVESITQFADNILENYVTEKYILNRIKPFMEHAKDKVTHICEIDVPRKITADKIFLGNALKQRSSLKDIMSQYRPIQCQCEMLLGKIEILLVEYFPECKQSFLYINGAKFQHQIGKGSFAIVQSAIVSINNEERVVAVKTLKTALDGMYSYTQLSEALILR